MLRNPSASLLSTRLITRRTYTPRKRALRGNFERANLSSKNHSLLRWPATATATRPNEKQEAASAQQPPWDTILPSRDFFVSAQKSGTLPFGRNVTVSIARSVWAHGASRPNDPTAAALGENLCNRFQIRPLDITVLSIVLNHGESDYVKSLAKRLLGTASSMGEPAAVIQLSTPILLGAGRRTSSANAVQTAMEAILELANGKMVVEAMLLAAEVYATRNKNELAQKFWCQAARRGSSHATFMLGKSCALVGDELGMEKALREGAKLGIPHHLADARNADSHVELSKLNSQSDTCGGHIPERILHSYIAAASGNAIAAHNLGEYFRRYKSPSNIFLAEQWYRAAAEAGVDWSMLQLARILLGRGQTDEATNWLSLATYGSPSVQTIAVDMLEVLDIYDSEVSRLKS